MNLQKATSRELISLGCEFSTKLEAINYLVDKLDAAGKLSSREEYYKAVLERESLSETGIDMGMAVPHGKSKAVREAAFAYMINLYFILRASNSLAIKLAQ